MNRWWASGGATGVELRGRRIDDDEDDFGGLEDFEEDDEFEDENLDEEDLEGEDAEDEESEEGYDDLDDDFDDDGEPRRGGGGRPRREWSE
jgi:hypothetical protein